MRKIRKLIIAVHWFQITERSALLVEKMIAFCLSLALLLGLATSAPRETKVYEFQGFTMEMEKGALFTLKEEERKSGLPYFDVYPLYGEKDTSTYIFVQWENHTTDVANFSDYNVRTIGNLVRDTIISYYSYNGLSCEDVRVLSTERTEIDGKPAVKAVLTASVVYEDRAPVDEFYYFWVVSIGKQNSYKILAFSTDEETLASRIEPVISSIRWTE